MQQILASKTFHIIGIPLIFIFIGVFINRLGRRDGDNTPKINDWAVGTITLLTALGGIAADLSTQAIAKSEEDILPLVGWFILVFFALIISIDNDRYRSWKRNNRGFSTNRKHILWGVIFPILLSGSIFVAYQYSKLGN